MTTVISVERLVKRYGDLTAVDGISFDVRRGEVFAFLGPNGAGKTTTCEVLETLRHATSGDVSVLGMDVATTREAIRERIGVLPQDFQAFDNLTCRENLRYFASLFKADPDTEALLARVGLTEKAKARYHTLSGGLKQRLGIAISLVNDPEIVFLDEPTTGLDPRARRDTWGVIRDLRSQGKTVFLTTHYMEEAQVLADRVAVIAHGRLAALDTPARLIQKHAPGQTIRIRGAAPGLVSRLGAMANAVDGGVHVHAPDEASLSKTLKTITAAGGYESLEVATPTLEDVFLRLTGERLQEGTA